VRAPKREPEAKAANTTTSKPRQSVLPLHAGNHTLHECETELPDRKKTCRRDTAGGTRAARQYVEGDCRQLCASAGRDGGQGCIVTSCLKASDARVNHHTWKGCRHPHIEPEQQESEKSAERRRKQLAAECWRMNTGVESVADLPSTWVAQDGTACVCSRKQRRNETSQGTWDAWCRAKVHGTLTSKL
jgi:hypothetical protein